MMDDRLGLTRKLNDLALQAALKRQDSITGLIYFDETHPYDQKSKLIPFVENLAFVLTLFNLKNQEAFLKAEDRLIQLLAYHKEGNFPKYLHEFPLYSSPYIGIFCYPYLMKIKNSYKTYLNRVVIEKLDEVMSQIKNWTHSIEVYHNLKPLYQAIHCEPVEALFSSYESALALSLLDHDSIPALSYQPVRATQHGHVRLCYLHFLQAQREQYYPRYLLNDHPLHLKLSLFYEPFREKSYPQGLVSDQQLFPGFVWECSKQSQHVIGFDEADQVRGERFIELSGCLQLHAHFHIYLPYGMELLQFGKKGTYFLKNEPIKITGHDKTLILESTVNLAVGYKKPPYELFDQVGLYLKVNLSGPFKIHLKWID
jgi:hypothetical protein